MQIVWLETAIFDLQRLRDFILPHNQEAAQRAGKIIKTAVVPLEANPFIGKPVEDLPDYYDLVIPFGISGYVLRYRIQGDIIFIIAVKHGKEVGFSSWSSAGGVVNEPVTSDYG